MTRELFIERSLEAHKGKFLYPEFDNYSSVDIKVPIICPTHGQFEQNPFDHIRGVGCSKCHFDSLKTWTNDEDELLRKFYKQNKAKWCAKKLDKTEHSIRGRATFLGITTKQRVQHQYIPAYIWNSLVARSKEKDFQQGVEIDFDIHYIWELYGTQKGKCALSGWEIKFSKNHLENTVSIDRIDSSKGYFKKNIQLTHKLVNRCKLNLPEALFLQMCKSIYKNNQSITDGRALEWEWDIWNDTERPEMKEYQFSDEFVLENGKIRRNQPLRLNY